MEPLWRRVRQRVAIVSVPVESRRGVGEMEEVVRGVRCGGRCLGVFEGVVVPLMLGVGVSVSEGRR